MNLLNVLGIALGLAMDAFAVSIAAGMTIRHLTGRHVFRLAWHFGLFQALMPILGWLAGRTVAEAIAAYDHWVAFGVLVLIGGKMLRDAARSDETTGLDETTDPTRGAMLVLLSIATSIDALAVGLGMALLGVSVWMPAVAIGLVAALATAIGIRFGNRLGARFRRLAAAFGGFVLAAIGVRILLSHLAA